MWVTWEVWTEAGPGLRLKSSLNLDRKKKKNSIITSHECGPDTAMVSGGVTLSPTEIPGIS